MTAFAKHAVFLFLSLRAGDAVNLAAGLWLVPKFVAPEELGAVLPVTTFATLFALPVFAFGMAVMKESADLARCGKRRQLKSLWRGVFIAIGILSILSLGATAASLPHYLIRMKIADNAAGFFILAAALLGSVAPVYTDALQATKRFRALGLLEILAAVIRFAALTILMPLRAFAGYFAGNAMQPLVRIATSILLLRHDLVIRPEAWWTRENVKRLFTRFGFIVLYLVVPMAVANLELSLVREGLSLADSAAYYAITRLSDLMNYLTFPLLIVLFPYAADAGERGRSTLPLVAKCSAVTLTTAILLGVVYAFWGEWIISLMPKCGAYTGYLHHIPMLLAITAFTACQTFYTNAEVAAGRFGFLAWFLPMNGIYAIILFLFGRAQPMGQMILLFALGALLRFICSMLAAIQQTKANI